MGSRCISGKKNIFTPNSFLFRSLLVLNPTASRHTLCFKLCDKVNLSMPLKKNTLVQTNCEQFHSANCFTITTQTNFTVISLRETDSLLSSGCMEISCVCVDCWLNQLKQIKIFLYWAGTAE